MSARDPVLLDPLQTGHQARAFEARLRSELVGQDDAVREVVRAYQRFVLGINTLTNRFGLAPAESSPTRIEGITAEAARRRFPPEFLNRIDKIVVFQTLGERELREILDIELRALNQRLASNTRFLLNMSESAKDYVLREGSNVRYGARYLKRVMERSLVDPLCNLLATGQIRSGDQIRVDVIGDSHEMVFYRDKENAELPAIPASDPSKTAQSVANSPTIDPAPPSRPILVGCCF